MQQIQKRLTSPIPRPKQIFAVAANYPSHLFIDLSLPKKNDLIERLRRARPRLFQKYPPVAAPGDRSSGQEIYADSPGPFGSIMAPVQVRLPTLEGQNQNVSGHLDYEAEIALLIGCDLSWDVAKVMSDAELYQVASGYLLFSDAKCATRRPWVKSCKSSASREALQQFLSDRRCRPRWNARYMGQDNVSLVELCCHLGPLHDLWAFSSCRRGQRCFPATLDYKWSQLFIF